MRLSACPLASTLAVALSVFALGLLPVAPAAAATYTESLNGDASGDRFNPTPYALDYGTSGANGLFGNNVLTGRTGRMSGVIDLDYYRVTVPEGYVLQQLLVGTQTTVGGGGSFVGFASGPTMPVAPNASSASGLLGWRVYTTGDRGTDILDDMQVSGNGASGFARPLAAGEYTFWIQELATGDFTYRFNFVLETAPVPLPAAAWLLISGFGLLGIAGIRRRPAAESGGAPAG